MNRGPLRGSSKKDFVASVAASWSRPPDWVLALAEACTTTSQTTVAKRVGYSAATLSQVLSNSYAGDLGRVEDMIRGALMQATVPCPILGEIGRDRCLTEQDEPFRATSAMRAQLYHECRQPCPFSKFFKGDENA